MNVKIVEGVIIERSKPLNFNELCHATRLDSHIVIEMIDEHLIVAEGQCESDWKFDDIALKRAKIAANFYHDLGMNFEGIALALDLLDKIQKLESRIHRLEKFEA